MVVPWQTIDTRGLLYFETFLPDRSSKYRETDWARLGHQSLQKTVRFLEKLTCSSKSCTSVGFLRGRVWFPLWSNVITLVRNRVNDRDRDVSTEEKARIFSCLTGLPASAEKDMFVIPTAYVGSSTTIDSWTIGFWSLFYPTDTRNTDRLAQENRRQKLSDFRKSLHVQRRVAVRWGFWDAGFGLLSGAPWFWRSGERGFDQRRMISNFGDPSGQGHVGGRRQDTHTADKVLTHGQTLLFYRYRSSLTSESMPPLIASSKWNTFPAWSSVKETLFFRFMHAKVLFWRFSACKICIGPKTQLEIRHWFLDLQLSFWNVQ